MECETSDSKKLLKVFEASKRRRRRKKREVLDESIISRNTMESSSGKQSLRIPWPCSRDAAQAAEVASAPPTPNDEDMMPDNIPQDQDSFIYAFLEEAIKKDKKCRQRHRRASNDREPSLSPASRHRHHHRRRRDDGYSKDEKETKGIDQALLLETFAKLCEQMNEKVAAVQKEVTKPQLGRTQSHKSLQCEVESRRDFYFDDMDQRPTKLHKHEPSQETVSVDRTRSHDEIHDSRKVRSPRRSPSAIERKDKYYSHQYGRGPAKYHSKMDFTGSKMRIAEERNHYRTRPSNTPGRDVPIREGYRYYEISRRDFRDFDDRRQTPVRERRNYDEDKRLYCEHKTSRSFDVNRERDNAIEERNRRTSRSDEHRRRFEERDRRFDRDFRDLREKKYDDHKYNEGNLDREIQGRDRHQYTLNRELRSRRNLDRFERASIASRESDFRDRFSERERDSGLSVADGDTSTISGRSNYLKVVKQEIAEQRDAMDKMMKLWKELMRCFKGVSVQSQGQGKVVQDSAASMQESAAAQLRLWRECMRRYETIARDVGDTDARLMEEINKQRSEMAEMASMWQECLQRYRDMSSDFNNLKQKLATSNSSPARPPQLPAAPMCPEPDGTPIPGYLPHPPPHNYHPTPGMPGPYGAGGRVGSPLGARASMPPWWWCETGPPPPPQRRRSSPESRGSRHGSRSREPRRRHKDDSRYKKESSKPNPAKSEHKHRKR